MGAHWLTDVFAWSVIVGFPIWDYLHTRRVRVANDAAVKVRLYATTVSVLWVCVVLVRLLTGHLYLHLQLEGFPVLAQGGIGSGFLVGLIGALVIFIVGPVVLADNVPAIRNKLTRAMEPIAFLLPNTGRQRWWFAAVSLTAGFCEEVLYRGFLFHYFMQRFCLPLVFAGLLSVAAFALAHTSRGLRGMLTTSLLGLVLLALYLATHALWLPIALHMLIDLRILLIWRGDDRRVSRRPARTA